MNVMKEFYKLRKAVSEWHQEPEIKKLLTIDGIDFGKVLESPIILSLQGYEEIKEIKDVTLFERIGKVLFAKLSKKESKIIIFIDSNMRIKQYLPVIKELKKRKISWKVISGNISVKLHLLKHGIKSDLLNILNNEGDKEIIERILEKIKDTGEIYNRKKIFGYVKKAIKFRLPAIISSKKYIEKTFSLKKPLGVVLENDSSDLSRLIIEMARNKGIKTFVLQHGLIQNPSGYLPLNADYMFVWGGKDREFYNKYGYQNVIVTGNPLFDKMENNKKKILNRLGIPEDKKIILLTPTRGHGELNEYKRFIEKILNKVSKIKNAEILLKIHPLDDPDIYQKIAEKFDNVSVFKNPSLKDILKGKIKTAYSQDLIKICDVMITNGSTSELEALAMNKKTIRIKIKNRRDISKISHYEIEDISKIDKAINGVLSLKNSEFQRIRSKILRRYLYKLDKNASKRIVNFILKKIKK